MKTPMRVASLFAFLTVVWPAAVQAQTWVDFSTTNPSLIFSATGQDFVLGTGFVNVRKTGGVNTSLAYNNNTLNNFNAIAGFSEYTFTFTGVPDVVLMETEFGFGLAAHEQVAFHTDGSAFSLVSSGTGTYNISGIGTDTVTLVGGNPLGRDAVISSIGATEVVWTHSANGSSGQGLRIGTSAVPEPSGALFIGLAGTLALLRRRRIGNA